MTPAASSARWTAPAVLAPTAEIAVGRLERRMAFLGHSTPNEARTYVKKANRRELADQAWGCSKAQNENKVSNRVVKLGNRRRNTLKDKGK